MKSSTALYLALGAFGLAAAILVPTALYRSGTPGLPIWASAANPGPLSSAHAFLGVQCESCHTPNIGIEAVSCITCHAPDAVALARPSTVFHATVGECRGCHIEHQGAAVRPIRMDHSILAKIGSTARFDFVSGQSVIAENAVQRFLTSVTGNGSATDAEVLNCASCHSTRDKHQGLFGQQCADCHATETWKIAGFLHPSAKSQECNQCHQAPPSHYMMHFEMMDRGITGQANARVEQCYICHQTDNFNNIKGVGWLKMH